MNRDSFDSFFGTVFRYLKYLGEIDIDFTSELGEKKFKQYDYNGNGSINLEEFRSMLAHDFHCKLWMETLGFVQ